jgi:hypothetical protein
MTTRLANAAKYGRAARPLNAFGQWCQVRSLIGQALDQALGVGTNTSYHYIRPLDHPRYSVPPAQVMAKIYALTRGAIQPNDFYDLASWRGALPAEEAA